MEIKKDSKNQEKAGKIRKIVTIVIVIMVFVALFLAAQYLVNSVNIVELLKKLHGG